ncbi:hypothetical protein ACIA99_09860 [Amycolatopsis magusensis]|uniref:MmyB family transcriptional regulator n=1 Tax=Amycolatopsis magusensis TaxID=882444 RepID=UPI0037BD8111
MALRTRKRQVSAEEPSTGLFRVTPVPPSATATGLPPAYGGNRRVKGLRREEVALARTAGTRPRRTPPAKVRPAVQQVLEAISDAPAWIRNGRHDILAMNRLEAGLHPHDPELKLNIYTAAPGSPTADGLTVLDSWAATQDLSEQTAASERR